MVRRKAGMVLESQGQVEIRNAPYRFESCPDYKQLKLINMEEVSYEWVIGKGWVVESENKQLKLTVEETLKEVDSTIKFQEYLDEY